MKKSSLVLYLLLLVVIGFGLSAYLKGQYNRPRTTVNPQATAPSYEPVRQPIIHYPVPAGAPEETKEHPIAGTAEEEDLNLPEILPPVQDSDQSIEQALAGLTAEKSFIGLLLMENFIQKLVATIDNLPEKKLARAHLPIKPPEGKFIVSGTPEAPQTSSRNTKRYTPYVNLLGALNQEQILKIYIYFYPLFQSAYEQLGYKNAYFNDRLVYVINHLLETPNPPDPILLAQPGVLYRYADPLLEQLSVGQKTLLRLGRRQRQQVMIILDSYGQRLSGLHLKGLSQE